MNEEADGDVSAGLGWAGDYGSGGPIDPRMLNVRSDLIGFALVFCASMGICVSLNMQKLVHLRNTNAVTGQAEVSFFSLPYWWGAVLLNIVSEIVRVAALLSHSSTQPCLLVIFMRSRNMCWRGAARAAQPRGARLRTSNAGHAARMPHRRLQCHRIHAPRRRALSPARPPRNYAHLHWGRVRRRLAGACPHPRARTRAAFAIASRTAVALAAKDSSDASVRSSVSVRLRVGVLSVWSLRLYSLAQRRRQSRRTRCGTRR